MAQPDRLKMLGFQQELHHFARGMLPQGQKRTLTASELELLSWLYLQPEESTPLSFSRQSGMKKEAVSRCLKRLLEKDCVRRDRHPQAERSYILSLTETGRQELENNYGSILRPLYELRRRMGNDFDELFRLVEKANRDMET